jgi:hypothetical protein
MVGPLYENFFDKWKNYILEPEGPSTPAPGVSLLINGKAGTEPAGDFLEFWKDLFFPVKL